MRHVKITKAHKARIKIKARKAPKKRKAHKKQKHKGTQASKACEHVRYVGT